MLPGAYLFRIRSLRTARSLMSRNMSSAPPARAHTVFIIKSLARQVKEPASFGHARSLLSVTGNLPVRVRLIFASPLSFRVSGLPPAAPAPAHNSAVPLRREHSGLPASPLLRYPHSRPTSIRTTRLPWRALVGSECVSPG